MSSKKITMEDIERAIDKLYEKYPHLWKELADEKPMEDSKDGNSTNDKK